MANSNIKRLNLMNEYAQKADLGNFLVNLESRLKALEGGEGGGDLSALQQKVSELEEKVTTLEKTVSTNGNKLTTVEKVSNQNKSDIGTLKEKVEALEGAGA